MPEMALQKECLYVRSTANTTGNPQLSGSAPGPATWMPSVPLARIPAPSNHEELRAQWCKQHLEELGATGVYIDDALNVIFLYGVEEGANDLCAILGHTDVVFPDTEPLPFREENGRFYAPRHRRRHHQRRRCHGDGGHGHRPQTQTENRHPLCAQFRRGGTGQPQGCAPADAGL